MWPLRVSSNWIGLYLQHSNMKIRQLLTKQSMLMVPILMPLAPRPFLLATLNSSQHLSRPSQMSFSPFSSRLSTGIDEHWVWSECVCIQHWVWEWVKSTMWPRWIVRHLNGQSHCSIACQWDGDREDGSDNANDVWQGWKVVLSHKAWLSWLHSHGYSFWYHWAIHWEPVNCEPNHQWLQLWLIASFS